MSRREEVHVSRPLGEDATLPAALARFGRTALVVGVVALAVSILAGLARPDQFFRSYLLAFVFWSGLSLGSLAVLMLQYLTGGAWGIAIRRILEAGTRVLPLIVVAFLPIVFGMHRLYEWTHADVVANDRVLQEKALYLNVPFFLVRAAISFAAWLLIAYFLNKWSREQDASDDHRVIDRKLQLVSGGGLVVYALTVTFMSIDWVMSLEPLWYSTIYGALFATGQALSGMAFAIAALVWLAPREEFSAVITRKHLRDLGNLMLAFILLWAYMAFAQFLLIWSGNLPEETIWYMRRLQGGWEFFPVLLILLHFVLPFLMLLSRDVKHNPRELATVAALILGIHLVDLYWVVVPGALPRLEGDPPLQLHWMDPAAVVGLGGIWLVFFLRELRRRPLLPEAALMEGPHHG